MLGPRGSETGLVSSTFGGAEKEDHIDAKITWHHFVNFQD
jgi:hypothetical protein